MGSCPSSDASFRASATSTTSTSTCGTSTTLRCRTRRFSADSSAATACSSNGWRQLSRILEFGGEIGDGSSFPGTDRNKNGIGSGAVYAHAGGELGPSNEWRAGLSYLALRPDGRQYTQTDLLGNPVLLSFSGRSQLTIADFVWKWAPNGNAMNTGFKLQGEYFWRKESGDLTYDSDGAYGLTSTSDYSSRQTGWYLDGVYKFLPSWRVGARYDRLSTGSVDYGANGAYLAQESYTPWRYSVMFDWTPSEFSRFRLQWQTSQIQRDFTDYQLFVQYILTLGAHGAHKF